MKTQKKSSKSRVVISRLRDNELQALQQLQNLTGGSRSYCVRYALRLSARALVTAEQVASEMKKNAGMRVQA